MLSQPDAAEWRGINEKTGGEFSVLCMSILVACSVNKPNSPSVFLLLGFWEI